MNQELADAQARFRKGRGTRDQITNIRWFIKKAREFQKNMCFCFIDYTKAFDCVFFQTNCGKFLDGNNRSPYLSSEKPVCSSRRTNKNLTWNNGLVQNWERSTSRLYIVTLLITYMQITSCEMSGWMKHKLESRLPGEISVTSNMHRTPPLWQKVKRN